MHKSVLSENILCENICENVLRENIDKNLFVKMLCMKMTVIWVQINLNAN